MIDGRPKREHNRITMPKQNHISVEIEASFGSPFQEQVGTKMLKKLLHSWIEVCESKHRKNQIRFRITSHKLSTTPAMPRATRDENETTAGVASPIAVRGSRP